MAGGGSILECLEKSSEATRRGEWTESPPDKVLL